VLKALAVGMLIHYNARHEPLLETMNMTCHHTKLQVLSFSDTPGIIINPKCLHRNHVGFLHFTKNYVNIIPSF